MNQICKVCSEPAAGFHFGAFTCEGCKSFFGRSYNNGSSISECKNNGKCIIDKKNRTTCKACRLRKCYAVGMSKGGSRYGRRSNWFKIHCLLQEQQQQAVEAAGKVGVPNPAHHAFSADMAAAAAAAAAQQHMHQQHQQRNPHMLQHMGNFLGYPTYLPEMPSAGAVPHFGRHSAADAAAAAAALPFINMMNSLPNMGTAQPGFQLPQHLLFPGYHPGAAAAAAADAAYRSEMYKHRLSVDSVVSGDSQRFTPTSASSSTPLATATAPAPALSSSSSSERTIESLAETANVEERIPSPVDVCIAVVDDEEEDHYSIRSHKSHYSSTKSNSPVSQTHHTIYNPIPIRPTPLTSQQQQQQKIKTFSPQHFGAPMTPEPTIDITTTISNNNKNTSTTTTTTATLRNSIQSNESISFAAKMQSLSPVSISSISHENNVTIAAEPTATTSTTATANDQQDYPMDLSMKPTNSSSSRAKSTTSSIVESDAHSGDSTSSEEHELRRQDGRRKFSELNSNEEDSDASPESVKRQKLAIDEASSYAGFVSALDSKPMCGFIVCA